MADRRRVFVVAAMLMLACGPAVDDGMGGLGGSGGPVGSTTSSGPTGSTPTSSWTSTADVDATGLGETSDLPERPDVGGEETNDPCLAEAYGCSGVLASKLGPVADGWGAFVTNNDGLLIHIVDGFPAYSLDVWFNLDVPAPRNLPVETSHFYWGSYLEAGEPDWSATPVFGDVELQIDAVESPGRDEPGCVVFQLTGSESAGGNATELPTGIYVLPTGPLPNQCYPPTLPP